MSKRLTDPTLLAWIADALEPGPASIVAESVSQDPTLQARVAMLQARVQEPVATPSLWRIPPPGIPSGRDQRFQIHAQTAAVMGEQELRPGDRFAMHIDNPGPPPRSVVVLRKLEDWTVVFPVDPEDLIGLSDLPDEDEGRRLDLFAGPEAGAQRWAVALPAADQEIDFDADNPWDGIIEGIADGSVPVTSVEIEVLAA